MGGSFVEVRRVPAGLRLSLVAVRSTLFLEVFMIFTDWDWRPAVLTNDRRYAFAVLRPNGPWTKVDRDDVRETAGVMSETAWRARFEPKFGPLDLTKIPYPSEPA